MRPDDPLNSMRDQLAALGEDIEIRRHASTESAGSVVKRAIARGRPLGAGSKELIGETVQSTRKGRYISARMWLHLWFSGGHRPARAADLKVARVEHIPERGRGLRRSLEAKHALVSGITRELVGPLRAAAARSAAKRTGKP
jgi:hypothetical protein